jgi:hypothetical protein
VLKGVQGIQGWSEYPSYANYACTPSEVVRNGVEGREPRMRSHSSRRGGAEARVNGLNPDSVEGGEGKLGALVFITKRQRSIQGIAGIPYPGSGWVSLMTL